MSLALLVLALVLAPQLPRPVVAPEPRLTVQVDSVHHEVLLEYRVPAAPAAMAPMGHHHAAGAGTGSMTHAGGHMVTFLPFNWPVDGWLRGARVELTDSLGRALPQYLLHHINLLDLSRRQLVHAGVERLWAAGAETDPVMLPAGIGVPLGAGTPFGLAIAYDPARLPAASSVTVRARWMPSNMNPRPRDVFPVLLDVNYHLTSSASYDLPPGHSERAFEFEWPLDGHLLGVGGHLHDFGVELRLEDLDRHAVLIRLRPHRDSAGRMLGMPQVLFGVSGDGKRVVAGRHYRLVAVYDNPGPAIPDGAMGEMGMAFMPDDPSGWPALAADAEAIATDLAHLESLSGS
ncbi:MAG TPA: hypothetical protein VFK36_11780 [Gemmatimonadales bacterium]|nr:hypothetical protein [Gemmatimonadales bacterium]